MEARKSALRIFGKDTNARICVGRGPLAAESQA